jgi:Uma2 family endonuclease
MAYLDVVPEIPAWLLDDTEESVVGTEWHQEARGATAAMLREEADRRGVTWGVCEEIELSGLPRPGGTFYNPRPDVMVLAHPMDGSQAAVALSVVSPPLFVAEIASESTLQNDREGKRIAYALAGIPEYLLFDPSGILLDAPIEAWRLPYPGARVYQPWLPGPDGSWRSQALNVWFVPDPPFLLVRRSDGRLLAPPLDTARRAARWETRALQAEAERQHEAAARAMAEAQREQEAVARAAAETQREQEAAARAMAEAQREQEAVARAAAEEALRRQQEEMDALRAELERLRTPIEPEQTAGNPPG